MFLVLDLLCTLCLRAQAENKQGPVTAREFLTTHDCFVVLCSHLPQLLPTRLELEGVWLVDAFASGCEEVGPTQGTKLNAAKSVGEGLKFRGSAVR